MTPQAIAEAFSKHQFEQTYEHFADDIVWQLVGGTDAIGSDRVRRVCDESAQYLAHQKTVFSRFETIVTENCIVIDSEAEYIDEADVSSTVASCDIYRFRDSKLLKITSYNIEIGA